MSQPKQGVAGGSEEGIHMTPDRPVHAAEAADGTAATAVASPLASGFAVRGGPAQTFNPPLTGVGNGCYEGA